MIPELAWLADGDNIPAERHRHLIELDACWLVVDRDDRPVGFVSAEAIAGQIHVWEFDVRSDLQGGGIGHKLIQRAIDDTHARALSAVTLTTWRDVVWNEKFYAKLGFKTLSTHEINARLSDIFVGRSSKALLPKSAVP
ncbi:MAG: GNAT family N-acetyltransferase [Xanthobacteraceae bacterium]|nr:GNAT family N-acetyltransferase [Xanthobacteraceae bacterium]